MGISFLFPPGAEILEDVLLAEGRVELIRVERGPYEALVHALGRSFHLMFRFTDTGAALSVPELRISTDSLAPPAQLARNWQVLTGEGCRLPWTEAGIIAQALYEAPHTQCRNHGMTAPCSFPERSVISHGSECTLRS